jgi:protein-S-isoprenylcysteine O-methyltransferase Ste14
MESPSVFAFAYFFLASPHASSNVPFVLFLLWEAHYVQRTLVYPFLMRVRGGDTMPLAIATSGFVFNLINSFLNANWIGRYGDYPSAWLADPRFVLGAAVFGAGYVINRQSDAILRNLRKPGESGYRIPSGGLYGLLSCPNYFGELTIWTGWTIATWSLAGLSFAVFTAANLVPRALANHRWYRKTFPDYPAERRAIVPFLL